MHRGASRGTAISAAASACQNVRKSGPDVRQGRSDVRNSRPDDGNSGPDDRNSGPDNRKPRPDDRTPPLGRNATAPGRCDGPLEHSAQLPGRSAGGSERPAVCLPDGRLCPRSSLAGAIWEAGIYTRSMDTGQGKQPTADDDLRPEYNLDFSQGERGKYYKRLISKVQASGLERLAAEALAEFKAGRTEEAGFDEI